MLHIINQHTVLNAVNLANMHTYILNSLLFAHANKVGIFNRSIAQVAAQLLINNIQELVRFLALYRIKSHAPLLVTGPRQFL